MSDQIPDHEAAREDANVVHADTNTAGTGVVQEKEETEYMIKQYREVLERELWCLACHQAGHRAQGCEWIRLEVLEEDPWTLLDRFRLDSSSDIEIILMSLRRLGHSMSEVTSSDFNRHINARDAWLSVIYHQMRTWNAPLPHDFWFFSMSVANSGVEWCATFLRDIADWMQKQPLKDHILPGESMLCFLRRIPSTTIGTIGYKPLVDMINHDLERTVEFRREWNSRLVDLIEKASAPFPWFRNPDADSAGGNLALRIDPADLEWVRKAFKVMVRIQPVLEYSDLYVVRWRYPNIGEVIATEGLEL